MNLDTTPDNTRIQMPTLEEREREQAGLNLADNGSPIWAKNT
jgi:hypothetical protein